MVSHRKISNIKYQISKRSSVIYIFLLICLFYYLFKTVTSSVFLKGKDKINVVFYGGNTRFYSIDKKNISYLLSFPNSMKVIIPGGYGRYKVGSVGKLSSLEKKQEIIRKTFSAASSSLIDLYFYPKNITIYQVDTINNSKPSIKEIFFSNSNANLIDKLFLFKFFISTIREDYEVIDLKPFVSKDNQSIFDYSNFYKKFQGSFFQKNYRNNDINVQIVYEKSYKTAFLLSQMIEGEGIRVVDLSNQGEYRPKCLLISNGKTSFSKTYQRLVDFFRCDSKVGETTVSDIILELGDLEKEWAVN